MLGQRLSALWRGHASLSSTGIYTEADEEETSEAVDQLSTYRSKAIPREIEAMEIM